MLITKNVEVKWNGANKKRYSDMGYTYTKMGDIFYVNVNDLSKGSHSIIKLKCDYCGKEIERQYKSYISRKNTNIINKDCCEDCQTIKSREGFIEKYGHTPEESLTSDKSRKKARQSLNDRYGVDNPSQIPEVMERILATRQVNYGKEYFSELMSGENNPMWKGGVKPANELARCNYQYKEWRQAVFEKSNYTCECCGIRGGYLEAHHIKGFSEFPDLRYDIDNGVAFCLDCHKSFHKQYGNFGFNIENLNMFITDYKKSVTTIETTA